MIIRGIIFVKKLVNGASAEVKESTEYHKPSGKLEYNSKATQP